MKKLTSYKHSISLLGVTLMFILLGLHQLAHAKTEVPSGFVTRVSPLVPKKFPKPSKCVVDGVRMACYDLEGIKQLLLVWHGFTLLQQVEVVEWRQASVLKQTEDTLNKYKLALDASSKAIKATKKSEQTYKELLVKAHNQSKADATRHTVVLIVAITAAVAVGFAGGYAISKIVK